MALRLIVSIKAQPGKGDEYLAEALSHVDGVRAHR
jgi:hypothetical protein